MLLQAASSNVYDYYHFFQGSDFPIKTKDEVDTFFEKNKGKEFLEANKVTNQSSRCHYYHFFTENKNYKKWNFLKTMDALSVKTQKLLNISRNKDLELYFGSALSSLSHKCVEHILKQKDDIKRRYSHTHCADEIFLQTIICNSPFKSNIYNCNGNVFDTCRYIDWERRVGSSPYTFCDDDYEKLVTCDESFCFARKFSDEKSLTLVEKIYNFLKSKNQ